MKALLTVFALFGSVAMATSIDGRVNARSFPNDPTYKGLPMCANSSTVQFVCSLRNFAGGEITRERRLEGDEKKCYTADYSGGGRVSLRLLDYTEWSEGNLTAISKGACYAL